jgi:hypothetical protein
VDKTLVEQYPFLFSGVLQVKNLKCLNTLVVVWV